MHGLAGLPVPAHEVKGDLCWSLADWKRAVRLWQLRAVLVQIDLLGHDEVIPHSEDPESRAYQSQKERLERNEFFKDCLAPQRAVLKVRLAAMRNVRVMSGSGVEESLCEEPN